MPAPPHSLHLPALHGERPANFVGGCCCAARPANICGRCCSFEACAGRRVHRLCPPAVALFCGLCVCLPCHLCHVIPLPFSTVCPVLFILSAPVHSMCARIESSFIQHVASCKNCPVGSCNTGLQRRPVRRFIVDFYPFSCRVHDPGPWCSVNN